MTVPITEKSPYQMDFNHKVRFRCHAGLECYTTCCADVTIFLTPYDVLRLKNRLGLNSRQFMEHHAILLSKEKQIIPLAVLRMSDNELKTCPFVTQQGCTVYSDRPWACRMYPLDVNEQEKFAVIASAEKCLGLKEESERRVIEWLEDQGVLDYQRVNNYYSEITSHPQLKELDVTNDRIRQMVYLASYDLDKFRDFALNSRFLDTFEFEDDVRERIRVDDTELLKLGLDWIKFGLFGQKTLKVRPEILEAKKRGRGSKARG